MDNSIVTSLITHDTLMKIGTYAAAATNPFGLAIVGDNANPSFADIDGGGDLDAFIGDVSALATSSFSHTVQTSDSADDLDVLSSAALTLARGTIKDAVDNTAELTLAVPGCLASLAAKKNLVINGGAADGIDPLINAGPTPTGTTAANSLNGAAGNDALIGGSGNDTLTGEGGADTFRFRSPLNGATNRDLITVSPSPRVIASSLSTAWSRRSPSPALSLPAPSQRSHLGWRSPALNSR